MFHPFATVVRQECRVTSTKEELSNTNLRPSAISIGCMWFKHQSQINCTVLVKKMLPKYVSNELILMWQHNKALLPFSAVKLITRAMCDNAFHFLL